MSSEFTLFEDLAREAAPPEHGILSRTILADDRLKAVLFGFATGEELSEHTASVPAIMQFIAGEADITVGGEQREARPGTWVHMPANMKHSVLAKTPLTMLLLMLKNPK